MACLCCHILVSPVVRELPPPTQPHVQLPVRTGLSMLAGWLWNSSFHTSSLCVVKSFMLGHRSSMSYIGKLSL